MNITFRNHLLGSVSDFCSECNLVLATPEILVDLIVRLSNYREEGSTLSPQVYLTDNINLLIQMLPRGEKVSISTTTANVDGIQEMLKICAPLTTDEWRIFGQQVEQRIHFGLFRGSSNPLSIGVDDMLLSEQGESTVIKAHQITDRCVQLRSSRNHNHHVFFDHRRQESPPPLQHIDDFVKCVVEHVHNKEKISVQGFMKNTLTTTLFNSHGCILAVTNMERPPLFMSRDAIILNESIDMPSMIKQLKEATNADSWLQLIEKRTDLIKGMISSDGITLFDQYGRLLGYRCFVSLDQRSDVVGGARRRAFETLRRHLGKGLSAIFIQSQDGWTDFRSVENG